MYTFLRILGKSFLLQLIEISTCIAVVRPQLQSCPSLGQHSKDLELLERAQRRHQDEQRDGAALLGGKAGRAGIVQPGEEKLWGELSVAFQGLKELQERWRETFDKGGTGHREWLPLPEGRDGWDLGQELFLVRVGRAWHRVPRAAVAVPGSLAVPKARLDTGAWSSLGQWKVFLPMVGAEVGLDKL
ncbi:hypothetical protein DUI87_31732 [Hirundo rustica rustica]|uniref:Uncharacterized protein n=1 Tax=Hirundo rustica rustica TaxID=333673 RepID=A0A3M0IVF3_HIRRU|nr:hypothetical protein DUI87_31732 [Hirundo rustica rustica]